MRIAHIILAHKNPDQILRLIDRLNHPFSDFYIHIDEKVSLEEFQKIRPSEQVSFIKNRTICNWGGNSLFECIINSLHEVNALNKEYDFINLLSAQDYPLVPATDIYSYFEDKLGMNFISYDISKESDWWKTAVSRYERYHFTDFNFKWKYFVQRIVNNMLPKRKFPLEATLYGGTKSTWWTLSGSCAAYITNQILSDKKLTGFLKYSWGTDEFVLATLVMNSPFKAKTVNNNLRYIDWSEKNPSPKLLNITDFEIIKESKMLFARKFDIDVDDAILDKIDKELLNK